MSTKENTTSISYKIGENFATDFDELQNIEIQNRKSDIGFSEFNQMVIKMRPGTTQVGNSLVGTGGNSGQFFFIDFFKKKHHIRGYNKKVWRLDNITWTDLGISFISNNFTFTPMVLPMMLNGSIPTEYTTPSDSSAGERVKKSASDLLGAAAIGKYLIITSNTANTESYRGTFASILDYDVGTLEYTLNGAGITTSLKSGAKYQIYDTLGEYLQISNGSEYERYFFGKSDGTMIENTIFIGLATKALRLVRGILDTEFMVKQISYYNSYWTFNKNTLYYSAGSLNNPFFYNFTTVLSIPGSVSGFINDLFVFKDRLIIGGTNYGAYLKGPLSVTTEIKLITQSYGVSPKTLADVGIDGYYLSTNQHIYSIKENLSGTTLVATDEGKTVRNYLQKFNYNLMGGFDGSKLYYYGEEVEGVPGTMIVLDIQYKFWSTYIGLSPSDIIFDQGDIYISDNNSDIIRKFDNTVFTDNGTVIEQKVAIKEVSLGLPFTIKTLTDSYLWLDNEVQDLTVSLYMANPGKNTRKNIKRITLTAGDVLAAAEPIGEGVVGEGIIGGIPVDANISLPIMKHLNYEIDEALLWKIIIAGKNGSPFYLNQLDIEIIPGKEKNYFSPNNTI